MSKHYSRKGQRQIFIKKIEGDLQNTQEENSMASQIYQEIMRRREAFRKRQQARIEHAQKMAGKPAVSAPQKQQMDKFEQEYQAFIAKLKAEKEAKAAEETKKVEVLNVSVEEIEAKVEEPQVIEEVQNLEEKPKRKRKKKSVAEDVQVETTEA